MSKLPLPNRLAIYCGIAAALLSGLAPLILDADWETTAGIIAGLGSITALIYKWLTGWQNFEPELYRGPDTAAELELDPEADELEPPDAFDEDAAEPIPEQVAEAASAPIPAEEEYVEPGTTRKRKPGPGA